MPVSDPILMLCIMRYHGPLLNKEEKIKKLSLLGRLFSIIFPPIWSGTCLHFTVKVGLLGKNTFAIPKSDHEYYDRSFVPSSIELWNKLPSEIRCLNSHKALKARLKAKHHKKVPSYFCYGTRSLNILHTKLRIGCSDLNSDKYLIGISDTDLCDCGGGR